MKQSGCSWTPWILDRRWPRRQAAPCWVNYSIHGPPTPPTQKFNFWPRRAPGPTQNSGAHRGEPIPPIPVEIRCNRTDLGPKNGLAHVYSSLPRSIAELKALNLLGVQFALCEASKARVLWFGTGRDAQKKATSQYIFFLRYESGSLYKPSTRDLEVSLQPVSAPDAARMGSIWNYWEGESDEEGAPVPDDLHPDHAPAA